MPERSILTGGDGAVESSRADSVLYLAFGLILTALLIGSIYWLFAGSGFAQISPAQHSLVVTLLHALPGQADQVQSLLDQQGYVSLWQARELATQHK